LEWVKLPKLTPRFTNAEGGACSLEWRLPTLAAAIRARLFWRALPAWMRADVPTGSTLCVRISLGNLSPIAGEFLSERPTVNGI
jgi:hypothetical protein